MAQRTRELQQVRRNRIPPHNLDAEQSVLGAMLESKEAIANVVEVLSPDDFYKPAHTQIYDAITALDNRGEAVDAITVVDELNRRGSLEQIGGRPYILGLLEAYPTASAAAHYARIVEELALLRRLIKAGNEVQEIGFAMPEDVADAVDQAEEIVYEVGNRRLRDELHELKALLGENMVEIETLYERGEHVTGVSTGFPDLDDISAGFQKNNLVIIAARPSMGKCQTGTSRLVDPDDGRIVLLEEFVQQRLSKVAGVNEDGSIRVTEVSDWINNGRMPCYRLTTRLGRTIEATANHPFLQVRGWSPLQELRPGNKIAIPRRLPLFGSFDQWSHQRCRLLAYYIAEGCLGREQPGFTNFDPFVVADFRGCIRMEFPGCRLRIDRTRGAFWVRGVVRGNGCNPVTAWLREVDLMGKKAEDKRFPDIVWTFTKDRLAHFLKALMSCDGTIYEMSGYPRIEFSVASRGLAEDVHHALTRFGIVSKLWFKKERCWRVEITDPESVQVYQDEIGWFGEKQLRVYPKRRTIKRSNNGHVPKEAWEYVRKALDNAGMSLAELARRSGEGQNLHTRRSIPQNRLAKYAEILEDDGLRALANTDLYWDEVVSIEPVGEKEVYDLTVPDGSNFIAQDICVHNSSILNDFALHAALKRDNPVPVVIFTLEMSRHEIVKRFLASDAKVDSQRISRGTLKEQDWARLSGALGRLAEAPIFIDDTAHITLMEIRAKCRRLKAKHGLGMIIIDYLQLMQSPRKSENRQQEVSEISRNLKFLARELEVPVLCASQLNRAVEMRADKRPLLGDLRESGSIEQDADMVMFLYRDEVYHPDTEARGEAELIVAKHRNGPTGSVRLAFMNQYTKFASLAKVPR